MNIDEIVEEIYDGGGGSYPAYSSPPRKDFAPISKTNGYSYPYQQGGQVGNLSEPPPEAPISYPWPLQTAVEDLADGFVLLMTATKKMVQCVNHNPTLTDHQKKGLIELYKKSKQALDLMKFVGVNLGNLNIAGPQPSQNPIPPPLQREPESLPEKGTNTIIVKIP